MKNTAMATLILMAAAGAALGEMKIPDNGKTVVVCWGQRDPRMAAMYTMQAQALASQIYARIGVTLDWRVPGSVCPQGAIQIKPTFDTPNALKPGALAYALPFQGSYVQIFADRVISYQGKQTAGAVLGHVLAHEIGHILQGICRHSETGVMKARWGREENRQMVFSPLGFTEEDVELIHDGLMKRSGQILVAAE